LTTSPPRFRRARAAAVLLLAAALTAGAGGCGSGRSETDRATDAARAFLTAWAAGDTRAAGARTDHPEAARRLLFSVRRDLRVGHASFTAEHAAEGRRKGTATVAFRARITLAGAGTWSYRSTAPMVRRGGTWTVHWTPSVVHPALDGSTRLIRLRTLPPRAPVLAADGTVVAGDSTVWAISIWPAKLTDPARAYAALDALHVDIDIPALRRRVKAADPNQSVPVVTLRDSVYQRRKAGLLDISGLQFRDGRLPVASMARALVGAVGPAGKEALAHAGPAAAPGDQVGVSGLQYRYQRQLAGTAATTVRVVDRLTGEVKRDVYHRAGSRGTAVRTTLSPRVQRAADAALAGLRKNAALVAVRPGDGRVLAVANNPANGADRALSGSYPPGSTFKTVTAAALLGGGLRPQDPRPCPKFATVDGQRFENQDLFRLPAGATFGDDFAHSCNTAFVGLRGRLRDDSLTRTAEAFGIGGEWHVGATTFDGSVPVARSENERAADMIGQGRVQAGPLVMASIAATAATGRFHQPVLVPAAAHPLHRAPRPFSPTVATELRALMRRVVTDGSGWALKDISGAPGAKTGTAEFGPGPHPHTHAWLIGFRGNLAFAVLLEDGGSGGRNAGPIAAHFLQNLGY
jgi:cell division protein FtsI/penicillin-binding protein 2